MCVVFHVMLKWNKKPRNRAQSVFTNATIQQRWFFTTGVCTLFTIGETLFRRLKPKAAVRQHKHSEPTCFRPNRTPRRSKRRKVGNDGEHFLLWVNNMNIGHWWCFIITHDSRKRRTYFRIFSSLVATFLRECWVWRIHSSPAGLSQRDNWFFSPSISRFIEKMRFSANNIVCFLINYSQRAFMR